MLESKVAVNTFSKLILITLRARFGIWVKIPLPRYIRVKDLESPARIPCCCLPNVILTSANFPRFSHDAYVKRLISIWRRKEMWYRSFFRCISSIAHAYY